MEQLSPIRRRWFRFSLRTLFVLFTLLSLPLCWIGYQLNWIREREAFRTAHPNDERLLPDYLGGGHYPNPDPPWQLHFLGDRGTGAWDTNGLSKTEAQDAIRLFPESQLHH